MATRKYLSGGAQKRARQHARRAFHNQKGKCFYCKKPMVWGGEASHPNTATAEHLTPLSLGGSNRPHNIVAACFECNQERAREHEQSADLTEYQAESKNGLMAAKLKEALGK